MDWLHNISFPINDDYGVYDDYKTSEDDEKKESMATFIRLAYGPLTSPESHILLSRYHRSGKFQYRDITAEEFGALLMRDGNYWAMRESLFRDPLLHHNPLELLKDKPSSPK